MEPICALSGILCVQQKTDLLGIVVYSGAKEWTRKSVTVESWIYEVLTDANVQMSCFFKKNGLQCLYLNVYICNTSHPLQISVDVSFGFQTQSG